MTSIILFSLAQSNRSFAPGREGTVIGIARLPRLVATEPLVRRVDISALTPRRDASFVGVSQLAGRRGGLSGSGICQPLGGLGPALLGVAVEGDRLPQRSARPVVRKSLVHRRAPKAGAVFRAKRETCHGAGKRSVAP